MSLQQQLNQIEILTSGEGFTNLTPLLNSWVQESGIRLGALYITALHTSCSLIINENADPRVLQDLSNYMKALVPEEGFQSLNTRDSRINYLH